jgi:hypothetical protein
MLVAQQSASLHYGQPLTAGTPRLALAAPLLPALHANTVLTTLCSALPPSLLLTLLPHCRRRSPAGSSIPAWATAPWSACSAAPALLSSSWRRGGCRSRQRLGGCGWVLCCRGAGSRRGI